MTFSVSDLQMRQSDLNQIADALSNQGILNPLETTIAEQAGKVTDYTRKYQLDDSRTKRLIRPLVLFELHALLKAVPESLNTAYKAAMKELEGIRDGQFPDLPLRDGAATDTTTPGQGGWGSRAKIL